MKQIYAVEINTPESGLVISRYFTRLAAARVWAKWCAEKFQTRILKGGEGGMEVK